jgi:hypothetical protein
VADAHLLPPVLLGAAAELVILSTCSQYVLPCCCLRLDTFDLMYIAVAELQSLVKHHNQPCCPRCQCVLHEGNPDCSNCDVSLDADVTCVACFSLSILLQLPVTFKDVIGVSPGLHGGLCFIQDTKPCLTPQELYPYYACVCTLARV